MTTRYVIIKVKLNITIISGSALVRQLSEKNDPRS